MTDSLTAAAEEYQTAYFRSDRAKTYDEIKNAFLAGASFALRERDAYAKAMAIALREGLFPEKARVLKEIESVLAEAKVSL